MKIKKKSGAMKRVKNRIQKKERRMDENYREELKVRTIFERQMKTVVNWF
jgi:hypothetical protein